MQGEVTKAGIVNDKDSPFRANGKLKTSQYVAMSTGALGTAFMSYMASAFLMIFYTDGIGVPVAAVSLMVLLVRIFDAVNDPLLGGLADRFNTRMGKYRPWVLFGGIGWGILVILMFSAQPAWSDAGKIAWMYLTYIGATVAGTCCLMSFFALNSTISTDGIIRQNITSVRQAFSNSGTLILGLTLTPVLAMFVALHTGYFAMAVIFGIVGVVFMVMTAGLTIENKQVISQAKRVKIPFKVQINTVIKNPALLAVIFGMLVFGVQVYGRAALILYYFTYYAKDLALYGIFNLVSVGASVLGSLMTPLFMKLFKEKGRLVWVNFMTAGVLISLCMFAPAPAALYWILNFFSGICLGTSVATIYSMLGDSCDLGEYVSGVRCDGFANAMGSFMNKVGGAIGPAIGGVIMAAVGYAPNAVQTPRVLDSINMVCHLMPGVLCIASALIFLFAYKLTREKHEEIRAELARRREEGSTADASE